MGAALLVRNLVKTFRVKRKAPGPAAAWRSLFRPGYQEVRAVDGISFEVQKGEMLALIGPNGAGKSTTIKLITGILFPDSGEISVLGLNPYRQRRSLAYRIGTVFGQKSQLWYHLPPLESLRLLADIYDLAPGEAEGRIGFLAEVFEIGDYLRVPVRKLSLGERIRCEIAASLLHRPQILFLDEPTIGLDVVVKQRIRDLILRMNREEATTVFLTSHDAGDIEKICRRAIVINHGRIVWDDTIKVMKYRLLRRKIIDLRLEAPLRLSRTGVQVLKARDYSAKLEVDLTRTSLEELIVEIMRRNRVLDITVSNPPMEEIIAMIYGRPREHGLGQGPGADLPGGNGPA
jgi:ABC-2 type transport system ATP-binding protein